MIPYIVIFGVIFAECCVTPFVKKTKLSRAIFAFIPAILLFLIFSLRSVSVGLDTIIYQEKFIAATNFSSISLTDDPGFYIFQFLIRKITSNFRVFLIICGLFIFGVLGFFSYKLIDNQGIGYLIFIATTLSMSLSALRQIMAFAFIMLGLLLFLTLKRFGFLSIISIFIGITFHLSAAVILFAVPFLFVKSEYFTFFYFIFLAFFIAFLGDTLSKSAAALNLAFYGVSNKIYNVPEVGIIMFCASSAIFLFYKSPAFLFKIDNWIGKRKIGRFFDKTNLKKNINLNNRVLVPSMFVAIFMLISTSNKVFPRLSIFFVPLLMYSSNFLINTKMKYCSVIFYFLIVACFSFLFVYLFLFTNRLGCLPYKML